MNRILIILFSLLITSCDFVEKTIDKIFTGGKYKLFIIASQQKVDINKFKIKKELYKDAYLTDVGYIVYTGIGKVKTTYSFTKFMTLYKNNVSEIYNIGTAGATANNKFGDMVECKTFVQNDYMNHDPNSRVDIVKNNMFLRANNDYTCLTTDSFITSKHPDGKFMFEMEAYANAEVAKNFDMLENFYAIKFVSDIVGSDEGGHWEQDAKELNNKLINKIKEIGYSK